ncbi:MAG TPA: erythromycin esterase family protein [Ferruginibacter sp.]|nr:erythromycin esterase family protein [Ferruginibacter sp.]
MKNITIFILICLAIPINTYSQQEVEWLKQNIVSFSLDSAKDGDKEFEKLKKSIGNARIVLLGEQSHGDGTTFETKVKLVRFLHQKMGFTVLAFESNQYNAERAWQDVFENKSPMTALQNSIFPIWGKAQEIQPLFEYITLQAKTKKPLLISGFDCQPSGLYINEKLEAEFSSYLLEKNIGFANSEEELNFYTLFHAYQNGLYDVVKTKTWEDKKRIWDSLRQLKPLFLNILDKKTGELSLISDSKAKLYLQFWKSVKLYLPELLYLSGVDKSGGNTIKNLRDSLMAENLIWLANEYYPSQKIIVWAASYHLAKHKSIGYGNLRETLMGDFIRKELDAQTYTITFTAYEGNTGWYNGKNLNTVSKPADSSFEGLFYKTGSENFFLDFRTNSKTKNGNWLLTPRIMRPLGYMSQEKIWPLVFDAVIFNRTMKKVNSIK